MHIHIPDELSSLIEGLLLHEAASKLSSSGSPQERAFGKVLEGVHEMQQNGVPVTIKNVAEDELISNLGGSMAAQINSSQETPPADQFNMNFQTDGGVPFEP